MYIDRDEIKKVSKYMISEGNFGKVHTARYNHKKYAYKTFNPEYFYISKEEQKRFEELCRRNDSSNLLLPKYLVDKEYTTAYLMDYYSGKDLMLLFNHPLKDKVKYLQMAKDLLIRLNDDIGIIHSDIHLNNFMINERRKTIALTDFDNAKVDDLESKKCNRLKEVNCYLSYNDYDKGVDTYMFNLVTFALLNDIPVDDVRSYLDNPRYTDLFVSKGAAKTLEDISNYKNNNNYLIDMIDDLKYGEKNKNFLSFVKGK